MKLIGVTGGVGAGKSEILNYMKSNYNCCILLADEAARTLEAPGGAIYQPLIRLLEEYPAADIMKIAMIRVWERILRERLRSKLILQIHDELLIETAPGEEDRVRAILEEEMQRAADLSVPLETDVHNGTDWYLAK